MVISIRGHNAHSNLATGGKDEIYVGNIPQVYYSRVRSDMLKGVAAFFQRVVIWSRGLLCRE